MKQSTDTVEKDSDNKDISGERENRTHWLERGSFRIALTSIFIALSIVLGYMLIFLPNIELITAK